MDSEQKQILEKLLEITEHNNSMLRKMYRQMLFNKFFTVLYWIIIIGIAFWSYNLIQPYLGMMTGITEKAQQLQNINISDLLK